MKVRMTADSTCDLSPELLRKYEIGIAPLSVIIDGEVFHDGVDVTPRGDCYLYAAHVTRHSLALEYAARI